MILALVLLQSADIDRWIADLGAEKAAVREAATESLKKAGKEAAPALRKAAESKDLEVAARAKAILIAVEGEPPFVKAEREATEEVRKKLKTKSTLNVSDVEAASAAELLSMSCEIPFHVSAEVRSVRVTADLRDVAVEEMLPKLFEGMSVTVYHGLVWVRSAHAPAALPGPGLEAMDDPSLNGGQVEAMRTLSEPVTFSFEGADAKTVMEILAKSIGVNLVVAAEVRGTASFSVSEQPAHVALRILCDDVGADWSVDEGGVVRVKKRE